MAKMDVQERINDIAKRSGMSEEIVRRVLSAETQSMIDSLKRGEKVTLIGRATIEPELRNKLTKDGRFTKCIKLTAEVNGTVEAEFKKLEGFETTEEKQEIPEGVRFIQLNSLM